ncbi:unnamed protein product [Polarella glacialis]|uniref:C2H2-type domain-containing protein n=1 Tax=Polarella glacialis TaxID=89957 RepID=A0A813DI83_POLGL|nr:unnamed protein product [Polarella glacialis]
MIAACGTNSRDLACRRGTAASALRPLRASVYGNQHFDCSTRLQLLASLVHSRLTYNVHVWCNVVQRDYDGLHHASMCGFRSLRDKPIKGKEDFQVSDQAVLDSLCWQEPRVTMAAQRLQYLPRLLQQGPACLFAFLQQAEHVPSSWTQQLHADVDWLRLNHGESAVPDSRRKPDEFFDFVLQNNKAWKGLVKAAVKRHIEHRVEEQRAQQFEQDFEQLGQSLGLFPDKVPAAVRVLDTHFCYDCSRAFLSKAGLFAHRHKIHGYHNVARCYADSDTCPACLQCFHSRARLIVHLSASTTACLKQLVDNFVPLPAEQVEELDKRDAKLASESKRRGIRRVELPAAFCHGPMLPVTGLQADGGLQAEDYECPGVGETLQEEGGRSQAEGVLQAGGGGPQAGGLQAERGGSQVGGGLQAAGGLLEAEQESTEAVGAALEPRVDEPGVQEDGLQPEGGGLQAGGLQVGRGGRKADRWPSGGCRVDAFAVYVKEFVMLRLFSRRRQAGDLQCQVEMHSAHEGFFIFVLKVDVDGGELGNLSRKGSVDFWAGQCHAGKVCGVSAAPPFGSWSCGGHASAAKVPVRSQEQLWGLAGLRAKQQRKVAVSNALTTATLRLMLVLTAKGGCGFIEAEAEAAVWALKPTVALLGLSCIEFVQVEQGSAEFGNKRTTGLLLLRFGQVGRTLRSTGASRSGGSDGCPVYRGVEHLHNVLATGFVDHVARVQKARNERGAAVRSTCSMQACSIFGSSLLCIGRTPALCRMYSVKARVGDGVAA